MSTAAFPTRPAASRRRRSWLRGLVLALLILLALLVIADRVAAYVAASRIAAELDSQLGTSSRPEVSIDGFPLVTQAIAGSYDRVQIKADGVAADEIGLVDVALDLRDVSVGLSDVLRGDVSGASVGDAAVDISIPEQSLAKVTGLPITIESVTDEVARLSTTFVVLGQKVDLSVDAMVVVEGSYARLELQDASAAGIDLPSAAISKLSELLGTQFEVPALVDGMHLDTVTARDGAVILHASGQDVAFPVG